MIKNLTHKKGRSQKLFELTSANAKNAISISRLS